MDEFARWQDDLGPARIIHVHVPGIGLRGVLVVDNVAAGPSIGGLRMAPDVTTEECIRLARAMTLKNAAAGLAHGGGKSVIRADPRMPAAQKETLVRAFAHALRYEQDYIFGPDMGTDETCMAWVRDELRDAGGRAVGLPPEVGGIPLDRVGATGWGLAHAAEVAAAHAGFPLAGARVVVQGYGAVGRHAARFLAAKGAVLVGAADSGGTIHDPAGLDLDALDALKDRGGSVAGHDRGKALPRDGVIDIDCEIWIPAARPDVLDEANVGRLRARCVLQGANIPCTRGAEEDLHRRGIVNVPDFIANAGGVICAAMEYHGAGQSAAFAAIAEKATRNTAEVLDAVAKTGKLPRDAAVEMATARVRTAMAWRRWGNC
ncbi:MAG: Glu/Leu/Phe/Val dehydrogenase [Rhodocyclaceae bacterium]|nr:Glu/Leu/Phe/Val dehydrogenase [Rhodocyclaceae bacterium]